MSPLNWDARLEALLDAMQAAQSYHFVNVEEKELFINALASLSNNPKKYKVLFRNGFPIVVDGRVERGYNK